MGSAWAPLGFGWRVGEGGGEGWFGGLYGGCFCFEVGDDWIGGGYLCGMSLELILSLAVCFLGR